jgi:aryl-alcohol dehydrogenase-like predicted oxidoreductase
MIVLGTRDFGTKVDEWTSMALLDRFVECGGTWIDTANVYWFPADPGGVGGQSERVIGRWLSARPGMRDRVLLSTKMRQYPLVPGRWPETAEGLSTSAIRNAIRSSLERLHTDYVDLYWAHAEDRSVPLEETVAAFGELADQALVRRLGASNHALWAVERARRIASEIGVMGYTAVQLRHSYVQPRPDARLPQPGHRLVSPDVLDYVRTEKLDFWAYTPLIEGGYTRPDRPLPEAYDHPGTARRLEMLARVADELGVTRNQVVLAWLQGGDPTVWPIVGVSTLAQLDEAMGADDLKLPDEHRQVLDEPA